MKIRADIAITDSGYIREAILTVLDCFNDKIGYEGKISACIFWFEGRKEIFSRLVSFNVFVYQIIQPYSKPSNQKTIRDKDISQPFGLKLVSCGT